MKNTHAAFLVGLGVGLVFFRARGYVRAKSASSVVQEAVKVAKENNGAPVVKNVQTAIEANTQSSMVAANGTEKYGKPNFSVLLTEFNAQEGFTVAPYLRAPDPMPM